MKSLAHRPSINLMHTNNDAVASTPSHPQYRRALFRPPQFFLLAVVLGSRNLAHGKDRRNPLSADLMRPPGYSLRERLEDIRTDMLILVATLSPTPLLFYALIPAYRFPFTPIPLWLFCSIVVIAYGAWKCVALVTKARGCRLGLEAEMAIGHELSLLMRDGLYVFHDIPGDKPFNIDHVVLGPAGVFAIETKGRSKPTKVNNGHKVKHDGDVLRFPTWTERDPLVQASRNAAWLSRWLSQAVGQPVAVSAVVCLPGWYVETVRRSPVTVISGKNSGWLFNKMQSAPLAEPLIKSIAHQLEQRCRDVKLVAYKPMPN